QHNVQIVPPYLYMAHYTHGVFVFSLDDLVEGRAVPLARLESSRRPIQSTSPTTTLLGSAGIYAGTWDVGLRDGLLYVTDGALRVASFGCIDAGDPAMTSTG
ncbi:MAG: hypothetical protein ACT4PT_08370, partial [Methanobacteriota archaeon]